MSTTVVTIIFVISLLYTCTTEIVISDAKIKPCNICNVTMLHNQTSIGDQVILSAHADTALACCQMCVQQYACLAFTFNNKTLICYLKGDHNNMHTKPDNIAGILRDFPPSGVPNFILRFTNSSPAINASVGKKYNIGYGFEGGRWFRANDGGYFMIPTESINDKPVGHPVWDLHMTCGLWHSSNGQHGWIRIATLCNSSSDCSGKDPCGAIFSPFTVFDEVENHWHLYYTCYTTNCRQTNGQQMHLISSTPGKNGLSGPYVNRSVALNMEGMGGPPDWWEGNGHCNGSVKCAGHGLWGLQPFRRLPNGTWIGVYGSAWHLGLVASDDGLGGPWRRLSWINPISKTIEDPDKPGIENPIITQTTDGKWYVAVYDAMTRYWPERKNHIGITYSADGFKWSPAVYLNIEPSAQPCGATRTPLGLVAEPSLGPGMYSLLFTGNAGGGANHYENVCYALLENLGESQVLPHNG